MPKRATKDTDTSPRARSLWSGTITFGLVNIPVELIAAVRPRRVAMRMVDDAGHALGRAYYCSKDDKPLRSEDIVRGYPLEGGKMVVVADEELDAVALELSREIELRQFVPLSQVEPLYFEHPYLLMPSGRSTKAYHLLAAAIERTGRVGLGTFVMRGRQYLVIVTSEGSVLHAQTLRFADEIRDPKSVGLLKPKTMSARAVKSFSGAIAALTEERLDPDELADRYAAQIRKTVEAKHAKRKDVIRLDDDQTEEVEAHGDNVIDLMKVLKQRLARDARLEDPAKLRSARPLQTARPQRRSRENDLRDLSKEELYRKAQALKIPGRTKMNRKALADAIRKAS